MADPVMVTIRLRGKVYYEAAIEYRDSQGFVDGKSVGEAGVSAVEEFLRNVTGNPSKSCLGNALVWFRASRAKHVVGFQEMWDEMRRMYGLNPTGKNHPEQYGRSGNWLRTSELLESVL